ncbi:MAG: hypothetical protein COA94_02850 [Rickettsiales bacterium]|nr:MAG: hypothetical protein COA94_02850 [Rickettsiales bacterium]
MVELHNFADQQQAAAAIFEYIEVFYNKIRLHSTTLNTLLPHSLKIFLF